jgi:hypothetical protein
LLFFTTFKLSAFAFCSSAAKRRDFDLLSQRRQALFENFFAELFEALADSLKPARVFQPAPPIFRASNLSPDLSALCHQRSPRL